MASKTGSYLRKSDRQRILRDLHQKGELEEADVPESVRKEVESVTMVDVECKLNPEPESFGTGCLACGRDDDHANIILCEACDAEYHTHCLEPPLSCVPAGDWYCPECKGPAGHEDRDGLGALVCALPPKFTSRFGEVCWAHGGVGFGWWPAIIYDPRFTSGKVREEAKKSLGKRQLVYFFACKDTPFSVLTMSKITKWYDGMSDDFHLGKTARSSGQKRTTNFREALQAATIEMAKPIEMRMDWNHSDQPQILPSPQPKKVPPPRKRKRRQLSPQRSASNKVSRPKPRSRSRGFPLIPDETVQVLTRRNLDFALEGLRMTNQNTRSLVYPIIEPSEDGELFVKILQKESLPVEGLDGETLPNSFKNVGFIKLASRKTNTFSDARLVIQEELVPDTISSDAEWRFFVPGLGPVSSKQETIMGPVYSFLRQTTRHSNLGDGTLLHPLKVFIVELKTSAGTSSGTEPPTTASEN